MRCCLTLSVLCLFVVCCLWYDDCTLLAVVLCLLIGLRCVLCWLVSVVCSLLFVVCRLVIGVACCVLVGG